MDIKILALGSYGDIAPCAALGGTLARRGHRVCLASHIDFAALARENDLSFISVAPSSKALVARAGISLNRLVAQFVELAGELARGFSANELLDADLILNQLPGGLYGWDLAEKAGIPMIALAYLPIIPTSEFAAIGWPRLPWPGYNRFTYRLAENLVWEYFRRPINRWRKETLGLPPQPRQGHFQKLGTAAVPWLVGFSPTLLPPPSDWGEHIRVTGYWQPPDTEWQPPPDLLRFLERGSPPVFIGFGSMTMPNPARVARVVLEAVRAAGLRAVLHSGWSGLADGDRTGDDRENIFPIQYAPYPRLFKHMAGVAIHGGVTTIHSAALAGIPTLVVPFLYDQFQWGRRIHQLGMGPEPLSFRHLSVDRLAERLRQLVSRPGYTAAAAEIGLKIQSENGTACAANAVEQYHSAFQT